MSSFRQSFRAVAHSLIAICLSLAASFLLVLIVSEQPLDAMAALIGGSFKSLYAFGSMLSVATVLTLSGLAAAVGFRAGAFNAGGEGQLYVGALAAAIVALSVEGPSFLVIALALATAALAGAAWIIVPALMRIYLGVTEIVTTLMASYVAPLLTLYLLLAGFRNPNTGSPETPAIDPRYWLPQILSPSNASWGLFVAITVVAAYWVVLSRTRSGVRMKIVGLQPAFAETVGFSKDRILLWAFLASGALAGLAGAVVTLGAEHRFIQNFSPGYGFLGITVALIGRLSPVGLFAASLFYGALLTGATQMQTASDVPFALVFIVQGLLLLLVTARFRIFRWSRLVSAGAKSP